MTGDELRSERKRLKLTQAGLAKKLGVNTSTVFRWEQDEVAIPPYLELALGVIGGDSDVAERNALAARLADAVMTSGFDDLENETLRAEFFEDMRSIAESMLRRKLDRQRKGRKKNRT